MAKTASTTVSKTITAENLGPISELSVKLENYGVTVLSARNGSGKSIFLDAVSALANGKGRLPLKDGTRKGSIEGFGARISIGGTTRHQGEFEILNLEGRFDLATLVDPGLKAAGAADRARIKALVALTNVAASTSLFRESPLFPRFEEVVTAASLETDDLVEMAARIKRDYDRVALTIEEGIKVKYGAISEMERAIAEVDLSLSDDVDALTTAYDECRDQLAAMQQQQKTAATIRETIDSMGGECFCEGVQENIEKAKASRTLHLIEEESAECSIINIDNQIEELMRKREVFKAMGQELRTSVLNMDVTIAEYEGIISRQDRLNELLVSLAQLDQVTPEDIEQAEDHIAVAKMNIAVAGAVSRAKRQTSLVSEYKADIVKQETEAESLRTAAKSTDEILSEAIQCDSLAVASDGVDVRLIAKHPIRGETPYHELSPGERWKIAIDLGADQVGEGGLLVIPQEAYEALDADNQAAIDAHSKERKVYVLTAICAKEQDKAGFEVLTKE